jgi:hypothetical protein
VVLLVKRLRARAPGVHWVLNREVAAELGRWPGQEREGEDAQVTLGRAQASSERQDHLGGGGRAVPRPRSRAAPEAAGPALRHDC